MQLTAIFEGWHIGDGNYPPFRIGMDVNLSFQIEPSVPLEVVTSGTLLTFDHAGNAEYNFVGDVLRNYSSNDSQPIAILDTGGFRFYIESRGVGQFPVGTRLQGIGTLLLDYYIWVEFPENYSDPPDLFYSLRVARIVMVHIPERFVTRHARGKSYPTRLPPEELEVCDYEEIESMEEQSFDERFCVVEFESVEGKSIPRTFRTP